MIDSVEGVVMGEGYHWGRGVETSPPAKGLSFIERGQRGVHLLLKESGESRVTTPGSWR